MTVHTPIKMIFFFYYYYDYAAHAQGNILFNSANGGVPIYVELVPFRVTADTTKQCIFGDEYNKKSNAQHQDEPDADWQGIKKKRLLLQGTENKGCKATMNLKYIKLYQEHKVGNYS
ncbi:hypothetical protein HPB51_003550 [Rhipicephalus microplus]|uniref:Uncharacterized protein n=1 Tax=Rhipicephalus microplus TaxID=6941 RepID=A0A9J6ER61_RHIMP|nr:hypothetical protein HPB51_003550 [Rhipicephalus microplus]